VIVDDVDSADKAGPVHGLRFSATDTPTAIDGVEIAVFDGEAVLFDPATSMLHRLGAIAGGVWLCCDGATDVAAMIDELAETFGLDAAELGPVVHASLDRFADEGLLTGYDGPLRTPLASETTAAGDGTEILTRPADP
jgi:hypothetical protein